MICLMLLMEPWMREIRKCRFRPIRISGIHLPTRSGRRRNYERAETKLAEDDVTG